MTPAGLYIGACKGLVVCKGLVLDCTVGHDIAFGAESKLLRWFTPPVFATGVVLTQGSKVSGEVKCLLSSWLECISSL